ncbi:kinase-like domain-containing protein [Podospora appendiculata]|uniref:Kinase-like domain-containing protein n=1 Tax=Podospora appendiculata TaxID=314037 RepID=A0AAE0X0N3_9PEZI|nr:kinase-like domain-containing protein [Podospora appendiculata]
MTWVRTIWGLEPRWTITPNETAILETVKTALDLAEPCKIEFLAQGAFNKLYTITSSQNQQVVARVTLPIDPKWKTLSEVATLDWVSENTSLPVPRVLGYRADRCTAIGFEWIAMEKMPGKPWADVWQTISFPARKKKLVSRIALFCSETFDKQLRGIGNIFPAPATWADGFVDEFVNSAFITNGFQRDIPRGPFASAREWIQARLDMAELDCRKRLSLVGDDDSSDSDSDEEEDPEDLETALLIIAKLKHRLDDFFPPSASGSTKPEPSIIFHDDLNRHNLLVDESGALTAVVDWECVSALPLFSACQYPPFLQGKPNDIEPIKSIYQHDENGEVAELYWEHLEYFELTQLRRFFLDEMRRLQPEWVAIFESTQRQRDYELAVASCDDPFMMRRILKWLEDMDSGAENIPGLEERIDNGTL